LARTIGVSTTAFRNAGGPTVKDNLEKACRLIDRAALDRPDIICLPETFACMGVPHSRAQDLAEPVPGPITEAVMQRAKRHAANIICPLLEKSGDAVYNSAAVIDRSGEIVGVYRKLHPVTTSFDFTEFEQGVTPGKEVKVFDLDFGRIGVLICFDSQWPQEWATLAQMGAEVVFWVSAYDGGFHLRAYAWDHHYYVVSAVLSQHAAIVDMTGEVLAESEQPQAVIGAQLNLEKKVLHLDFNGSQVSAIKKKYGRGVIVRPYPKEACMTVESARPDLSLEQLMAEFGLETIPEYVARHERAEAFTRNGRRPEAQAPRRVPKQYVDDL